MTAPVPFREPEPLDARLVTKTSLPKPKKAIALLIVLWYANNKAATVEYGKATGNNSTLLDDEIIKWVEAYCRSHYVDLGTNDVADILEGNPLLESQMEALNSAFELVWHLASFEFTNASLSRGAERKGGIRYRKRINYSTNLDLIDLVASSNPDLFARVMLSWMSDGAIDGDEGVEKRLTHMLSVFVETSFFKSSKGETGTVFAPSGIYDALLNGESAVDIVDPGEEAQGTTRILKPAIENGLNPLLSIKGNSVSRAIGITDDELQSFSNRAKTGIALSNVKVNIAKPDDAQDDGVAAEEINHPRNYIFFGAPGTGKSYQLNKLAVGNDDEPGLFSKENVRRVTFYPDYTYSQFVGCFKPYAYQDDKTGESVITYRFIMGPFLETYLAAVTYPDQNYLLIVEEINRANPAATFGDVFQLLDRDADGRSEYGIAVPFEMKDAIKNYWLGEDGPSYEDKEAAARANGFATQQEMLDNMTSELKLPPNMYIWATMNSADQGVFPMDTAFKRRWDFRYMDINDGASVIADKVVTVAEQPIVWDRLRRAINDLMADNKINEDKLLGPFFVSPDALNDERFVDVFKDKVLLYLYEDAGKMKRKGLFTDETATYSELCKQFEEDGVGVFKISDFADLEADSSTESSMLSLFEDPEE